MINVWKEAQALKEGEREFLAKIGSAYLELEELNKRSEQLRRTIEESKAALGLAQESMKAVLTKIVDESGVKGKDGDYVIDFQSQRVVPKNGQISHSSDR